MNAKMVAWGVTIALALIASILVFEFAKPEPGEIPVGFAVYAGEGTFNQDGFAAFKNYIGSSPDIRLEQSEAIGEEEGGYRLKFEITVPEGQDCPYGDYKGKVGGQPLDLVSMAYGVAAFVGVILLGAWVVNMPRLGLKGRAWGRH